MNQYEEAAQHPKQEKMVKQACQAACILDQGEQHLSTKAGTAASTTL
jgi:hypothetical protein